MCPKWGLGVAMLPMGALYFYQTHVGCAVLPKWPIWAHLETSALYFAIFQSLGGHASAKRTSHKTCFRQAHCFIQWRKIPHKLVLRTPRLATEPQDGRSRLPDPEFTREMPKKYSLGRCSRTPTRYLQNTDKIPKTGICVFRGYFFDILGVFSGSADISAGGVFFRYFSGSFRVQPSRGSVASRGVLKHLRLLPHLGCMTADIQSRHNNISL